MKAHRALVFFPLAAALLSGPSGISGALAAQPPVLSDPFLVSWPFTPYGPDEERHPYDAAAVALANGEFAVTWAVDDSWQDPWYGFQRGAGLEERLVDASGQPGPGSQFHGFDSDPYEFQVDCPALAATAGGGYVLAYSLERDSGTDLWMELPGGGGGVIRYVDDGIADSCPALAVAASGSYVVAWPEVTYGFNGSTVFRAQWFTADGKPQGDLRQLGDRSASLIWDAPALGMDAAGRTVVVWPASSSPGLRGQRFGADGTPMGEPFPVADGYVPRYYDNAFALAMAPDGGFTVAWIGRAAQGELAPLLLRRFEPDGTPATPEVEIGRVQGQGTNRGSVAIAVDRHGNFTLKAMGRLWLFNRWLVPRGGPIATRAERLAMSGSGRVLGVWTDAPFDPASPYEEIHGQFWQARHEADLCLYRGSRFLCDTAGSGTVTEEIQLGLGMPRFVPLLGDIDGDGRADPCVRRGDAFSCDTAHDGGGGEVLIRFGLPGDTPLLGDVDGDGRADPCVFRAGRFLCDTAHDGGAPEVTIAFGRTGDLPLLGDVDGDGRADPCVYRQGVFLCDTAHDGSTAEVRLDLRPALGGLLDGAPLLGDIEGIGQADACLYRGGSLTCGQFAKTGGKPLSAFTRATAGEAGDVPLLGDLDAF